jgi:hypothetical protein
MRACGSASSPRWSGCPPGPCATTTTSACSPSLYGWQILDLVRPLTEPQALARGHVLYERLDELDDADPADPRVPALAADLAAHIPDAMAAAMIGTPSDADGGQWLEALSAEVSPAQAEVFRLLVITLKKEA